MNVWCLMKACCCWKLENFGVLLRTCWCLMHKLISDILLFLMKNAVKKIIQIDRLVFWCLIVITGEFLFEDEC